MRASNVAVLVAAGLAFIGGTARGDDPKFDYGKREEIAKLRPGRHPSRPDSE